MICKEEGCFYNGKYNGYCCNHRQDIPKVTFLKASTPAKKLPVREISPIQRMNSFLVVHSNPSTPE